MDFKIKFDCAECGKPVYVDPELVDEDNADTQWYCAECRPDLWTDCEDDEADTLTGYEDWIADGGGHYVPFSPTS